MRYLFDETQHLHAGYYENGFDVESTVYKLIDQDAWIMYVEWEEVKAKFSKCLDYSHDPLNGLEIMCILGADIDNTTACLLLERWLISMKIVE